MSVSLKKGQKVSLKKGEDSLKSVMIGLGWDAAERKRTGFFAPKPQSIDCDASAIVLQSGKLINNADIVYFGNLQHKSGAIKHMGDNLTGEGVGDDEQIFVDLEHVPAEYDKVVVVVNIYQAVKRNQHFGMIKNAFIRIMDGQSGTEMFRYDLTEDYSGMTAMIFGEVYRHNGEWKFNPIGQGTNDPGLGELAKRFV
ncbi:stress protein [Tyzzerella sp. An114]|uniref:TerD family protein n=1 Tax=Tyzzerella sp. An114 TaxID=1965545 RepID=UPI000B43CB01|nr:TerD family protein [Tyzzerella sp. An114]OUQ60566.1 stress protein [Tyzzerella sp. An114]HIT72975.1 TerD family protein [Candidatus Fimicola cottocaccae]